MKHDNQIAGGVRMDNTVFERNYEKPQEDMEYCTAVFEQAVEGGFFSDTVTWWIKSLKLSIRRIRKTTNTW